MPFGRLKIVALIFLFQNIALAKEAIVFDVRRPQPMVNGEVLPQDFYINMGSEDGMKVDMVVTVNRRQTMYDAYTNKSPGDLIVAVGQLRVIHVQQGLSVARLEKMYDRASLPSLDYDGVMVGDRLDMGSARVSPRKTAAIEVEVLKANDKADFSSQLQELPAQTPVNSTQPM